MPGPEISMPSPSGGPSQAPSKLERLKNLIPNSRLGRLGVIGGGMLAIATVCGGVGLDVKSCIGDSEPVEEPGADTDNPEKDPEAEAPTVEKLEGQLAEIVTDLEALQATAAELETQITNPDELALEQLSEMKTSREDLYDGLTGDGGINERLGNPQLNKVDTSEAKVAAGTLKDSLDALQMKIAVPKLGIEIDSYYTDLIQLEIDLSNPGPIDLTESNAGRRLEMLKTARKRLVKELNSLGIPEDKATAKLTEAETVLAEAEEALKTATDTVSEKEAAVAAVQAALDANADESQTETLTTALTTPQGELETAKAAQVTTQGTVTTAKTTVEEAQVAVTAEEATPNGQMRKAKADLEDTAGRTEALSKLLVIINAREGESREYNLGEIRDVPGISLNCPKGVDCNEESGDPAGELVRNLFGEEWQNPWATLQLDVSAKDSHVYTLIPGSLVERVDSEDENSPRKYTTLLANTHAAREARYAEYRKFKRAVLQVNPFGMRLPSEGEDPMTLVLGTPMKGAERIVVESRNGLLRFLTQDILVERARAYLYMVRDGNWERYEPILGHHETYRWDAGEFSRSFYSKENIPAPGYYWATNNTQAPDECGGNVDQWKLHMEYQDDLGNAEKFWTRRAYNHEQGIEGPPEELAWFIFDAAQTIELNDPTITALGHTLQAEFAKEEGPWDGWYGKQIDTVLGTETPDEENEEE